MSTIQRILRTLLALVAGAVLGLLAGLLGVGIAFWTGWQPRDLQGLAAYVLCIYCILLGSIAAPLSVWLRRAGPFLAFAVPLGLNAYFIQGSHIDAHSIPFVFGGSLGFLLAGSLSGLAGRYLGTPRPPAPESSAESNVECTEAVLPNTGITTALPQPLPGLSLPASFHTGDYHLVARKPI
ncbi:MAG: hypothetical protein AB7K24_09405 [Gemmataceae bacterium]